MIEFNTILVPVDFSDVSRKAVNYGLTLALHFKAKLFLAHIVPYSSAPTQTHDVEQQQCETARREIQNLIPSDYKSRIGIETIVKIGNIDSDLLGIVRDESADLIVMGTHGRRHLDRWLIGSVTERLLRKAPVPLLTMSHVDVESAIEAGPVELKRILYATDLPENSSDGLRYAIKLARTLGAALTVVHAVDHANFIYWAGATAGYLQEQLTVLVQERRRTLSELVTHEETAGLHIETLVVEGKPFKEILRVAEERAMDIIVLNLQSKGILERAFLGSTAERVVRLSHIPVLSVPFLGRGSGEP